ncbi:MAG: carboxylate-amine ligase [Myxococcota bacterium]
MVLPEPSFTVGIEEEYLLVDPTSRDLVQREPEGFLRECEEALGEQVRPEFLQSQVEVGTRVCRNAGETRDELARLRRMVAEIAGRRGLAIIASSSHPFASSARQQTTRKERYRLLADDLQAVARRLVIGGMHVHVGIDDPNLCIDLMSQVTYFLPHLLALSTSSPYWEGHATGLMSYRIAVWDELPRTGIPEAFESHGEYERHVETLVRAGLIEDATRIWWDVRPSARFPTLEMRITDLCTRLEDAVCIAAIYRCWLHMLYRLRRENQRWRRYSAMLISENRWRAQRYGIDEGLVDFGRGEIVPYGQLLDDFLALIRPDAERLDCVAEVEHARTIVERGTSAHWQLRAEREARAAGADEHEALQAVVDMLIRETLHGA